VIVLVRFRIASQYILHLTMSLHLSCLIAVIITDNPSTTTGPPIGLGWTHDHSDETVDVDAYESCRVPPRSKRDFVLPSAVRWEMLRSAGSSNEDLMKASQEVKKRQTQRQRSLRRQERMESFASAIRCIVPRRKGQQG
jgi:hypothetical protein